MATHTHTIRRCFMTGRQCIFCKQNERIPADTLESGKQPLADENVTEPKEPPKEWHSVFVARPFRDNLAMCHSWSLEPHLKAQFKGIIQKKRDDEKKEKNEEKKSERTGDTDDREVDVKLYNADGLTRIGAITCEKICRPIQMAEYLVADVSVPNPNVMYELGLALGLGRGVLLISYSPQGENTSSEKVKYAHAVAKYIDATNGKIFYYNGVSDLSTRIIDSSYIITKEEIAKKYGMRFVELTIPDDDSNGDVKNGDIAPSFSQVLNGAIGVALKKASEMTTKSVHGGKLEEQGSYSKGEVEEVPGCKFLKKLTKNNFENIKKTVDEAFCCIIDLAGEAPLAYFWLGYCHAQGINVIPIYRKRASISKDDTVLTHPYSVEVSLEQDEASSSPRQKTLDKWQQILALMSGEKTSDNTQHILAFDIRALWYIDYEKIKPEQLAGSLTQVFSELIRRDFPRLQKDCFWDKLAHSREIHIYTGAIYNSDYSRATVGDWDQRTVSELVEYLASADSTVRPILAPPFNMPEQPKDGNTILKKDYHGEIKELLKNQDCIIVASADVNSLTEILLAHAYLPEKRIDDVIFTEKGVRPDFGKADHTVIALKNDAKKEDDAKKKDDARKKDDPKKVVHHRLFSRRTIKGENLHDGYRGFLIGTEIVQTQYSSSGTSELLSHFMLMKNPFNDKDSDNYIVILNGVSGPGTYALAEILTGGKMGKDKDSEGMSGNGSEEKAEKNKKSEEMLKEINTAFDEIKQKSKHWCIQGIVKVKINQPKMDEKKSNLRNFIYDQREIEKWEWCKPTDSENPPKPEDVDITVPQKNNPWYF